MQTALAALLVFAAAARGAHDLWAATIVHLVLPFLAAGLLLRAWRSGEGVRFPAWGGSLLLFAGWMISFVWAGHRADALFAVKDLAAILIVFFLGANLARDEAATTRILHVGVGIIVFQSFAALYQALGAGNRPFGVEAAGALVNPNILAGFSLLWLPPLVSAWRRDRGTRSARWWMVGVIGVGVSLAASGSVWAWICLISTVACGVALTRGRRAAWMAGGAVLVICAAAWYKFTAGSFDRIDWWRAGLDMFRAHPFTGVGPGGYPSAFPAFKIGDGQSTRFAHSFPVTVLAETGLAGLLGLLSFVVAWSRSRRRSAAVGGASWVSGVALFLAFTSVSIGAEYLVNAMVVSLFLGLAAGGGEGVRARLSVVALVCGLAIVIVPFTVSAFFASRLTLTGQGQLSAGLVEEAAGTFAGAVKLDDSSTDAWAGRAEALWQMGLLPDAIAAQESAVQRHRFSVPLTLRLAEMLSESGRPDEAAAARAKAHRLNPRLFSDNAPTP